MLFQRVFPEKSRFCDAREWEIIVSFLTKEPPNQVWYALEVTVVAGADEAASYGLMEAGSLGTETASLARGRVLVTGYFGRPPVVEEMSRRLSDAMKLYNLPSSAVLELNLREIADRDWLAEWKKDWQPVEVGRFIIAPPWSEVATNATQIVIRIEPGMAFGTGTHETTRLCLIAIGKYFQGGSFLDVGTGTGILAIAAAKMFIDARIEACDTDGEAIAIARENAGLNDLLDRIVFRTGSVGDETSSSDLVCANLTAPVIVELLPSLLGATCGRLVLSGILDSQVGMVQSRLIQLGIADLEINSDGEWVSIVI
jgi:ribosomal protein L11 methyltransferase